MSEVRLNLRTQPGRKEYDQYGNDIGRLPDQSDLDSNSPVHGQWHPSEIAGGWEAMDCVWDGQNVPCGVLDQYEQQGSSGPVMQAPASTTASIWSHSQQKFVGLAVWDSRAAQNGIAFLGNNSLGWLPTTVSYSPGSGFTGENVTHWFTRGGLSELNRDFLSEAAFDEVYGRRSGIDQPGRMTNGTGGGAGSGGGNTNDGPKAKLPDGNKVAGCLKNQFGNSAFIHTTTANGTSLSTTVGLNGSFFTVTTNLNRFSASELGLLDANQNNVKYTGWTQSGYTMGNNPTSNDIAREVTTGVENGIYNPVGFMAVYYHELGNAIGGKIYADQYIAAKTKGERAKLANPFRTDTRATNTGDRDSGVKLERCLFGGIVSLTSGRIGNGRDW